jgi:hypothetical protein
VAGFTKLFLFPYYLDSRMNAEAKTVSQILKEEVDRYEYAKKKTVVVSHICPL